MAMNDDWTYIWSARVLAETGHVVYNGWSAAIVGWQLYLGALFIKLFGFSFFILRVSMLLVAMATVALVHRLFVRFGISEANATLGTLTLALSPWFLPLAFSFMSDVAGLFALLACVYGCVRAVQADSDRAAFGWLAFAAGSNLVLGTVRQTAWLGVLVMMPATAVLLGRRRGLLAMTVLLWVASASAVYAWMGWFSRQPNALAETVSLDPKLWWLLPAGLGLAVLWRRGGRFRPLLAAALLPAAIAAWLGLYWSAHHTLRGATANLHLRGYLEESVTCLLDLCLCTLPVLSAFALHYVFGSRRAAGFLQRTALLLALALPVACLLGRLHFLAPFLTNIVTARGIIDEDGLIGSRPLVLTPAVQFALTVATLMALAAFLLSLRRAGPAEEREETHRAPGKQLSLPAIAILLGPFTAVYMAIYLSRTALFFDRYLLPVTFTFLLVMLRLYQRRFAGPLPLASVLLMLAFASFGVAGMHDVFAMHRARLAAADTLLQAGVARTELRAGFEYDAWTQLEAAGFVNTPAAHLPTPASHLPPGCDYWFAYYTPAITPRYVLSFGPSSCFLPSRYAPVAYQTWLPWKTSYISIEREP